MCCWKEFLFKSFFFLSASALLCCLRNPSLLLFKQKSFQMYIIPELTQKTNSSDCRDAAEFESAAGLLVAGASAGEKRPGADPTSPYGFHVITSG